MQNTLQVRTGAADEDHQDLGHAVGGELAVHLRDAQLQERLPAVRREQASAGSGLTLRNHETP